MSAWISIRNAIEAFFTGPIWEFVKPFLAIIEHEGGSILVSAAEDAVVVGFATVGSGTDKMKAALDSFAAAVNSKGLSFVESEARLLIEAALQKAKTVTSAN